MFVPRALRLKGIAEPMRPRLPQPPADETGASKDNGFVDARERSRTSSSASELQKAEPGQTRPLDPKFTVEPITAEYLAQLRAGVELIFSDYAHQEDERSRWLQQRYRTVDGEANYVHLAAILEHPNIATLKPAPSQVLLQRALRAHPSDLLELADRGYHVRRKPSTYPPKFLPHNSFEITDDDGLSFWDMRTIYVEPHVRNLCQTPARLAYWLTKHGQLRPKWLPVQAVHMLWNSCAFVVLSGSVMHVDIWSKWRAAEKPDDWKVMTKVEHTKRTAEYAALIQIENPKGARKAKVDNASLPPIARPAALALNVEVVPHDTETMDKPKTKRKRKRHKFNMEANGSNTVAGASGDEEPSNKRCG